MIAEHAINELGESADVWDEFAFVEVEVLAPERTLLEKLAMLHDRAARSPDDKADAALLNGGRHLYDVHRLLGSDSVINALAKLGSNGVAALCSDIDEHSAGAGSAKLHDRPADTATAHSSTPRRRADLRSCADTTPRWPSSTDTSQPSTNA